MLPEVSAQLSYWLEYRYSLTEKVSKLGAKVEVQVLKEWWLGETFKRDVLIFCDNFPCWYGRTIMPKQTYFLKSDAFKHLGSDPIGSILYHSPDITLNKRRFFRWYEHWYHSIPLANKKTPHWGRASTFHINQSPLYLMELFLPNLIDKIRLCP